jgi:hypothetical protein
MVYGLSSMDSFAQNHITDTTAEIVPYWKKGESKLLDIVNTREKYFNNALVYKTNSVSEVLMTVLEETDSVYKIEWHYIETSVSESEEPIVKRLAEISNGFKIVYQTSETGMFQKLLNYPEIEKHYAKGMENLMQQYGNDTVNQQLLNLLESVFYKKNNVDATFTKEIKLFHFPFGAEYNINKINEEIVPLPHPFVNDTIQEIIRIKLTEINLPAMTATLECWKDISHERSLKIIEQYKKKMEAMNQEVHPQTAPFESHDKSVYEVELMTGWLVKAMFEQTSVFNHITQKDITTISARTAK